MNFANKIVLRLASPATRAGVFDATALEQFLTAAYDTSQMALQGPFSAIFEEFQLGMAVPGAGSLDGQWGPLSGSEKTVASFRIAGLGGNSIAVDAFWRGSIVARTAMGGGRIQALHAEWPDPGAVDREIVQALGALPADPAARETERRNRLKQRLKAAVADADVVTDEAIDRLVSRTGASTLNEYFELHKLTGALGAVRVQFVEAPAPQPSPKPLPVAAAILVREGDLPLVQLLGASRAIREHMESAGLGRTADNSVKMRFGLLVVWVLNEAVFQDADWPGATVEARRQAAGEWLAREGIGLAVVK